MNSIHQSKVEITEGIDRIQISVSSVQQPENPTPNINSLSELSKSIADLSEEKNRSKQILLDKLSVIENTTNQAFNEWS